jgi:hypothetical protein
MCSIEILLCRGKVLRYRPEQDQNNANFRGNDVASLIQFVLMYTVNIYFLHTYTVFVCGKI